MQGYRRYSEVDNLLMGMHLSEYAEKFEEHRITLEQFLMLSEEDLEKMGIAEASASELYLVNTVSSFARRKN